MVLYLRSLEFGVVVTLMVTLGVLTLGLNPSKKMMSTSTLKGIVVLCTSVIKITKVLQVMALQY